jgi:membrane-associated PAP2 superfamily phosphatase
MVHLLDYYRSQEGHRFLLRHALLLAGCAVALKVVFGDGRVDLAIARWFFDDAQRNFPLKDYWLLKSVLHDAARTTSACGALVLLALTFTSWVATQPSFLRAHRLELLFASLACLIAAASVGALKHLSAHACPWDLAMFGGSATYHPPLVAGAAAETVQGCLPAAHPLTGYAWLGLGFSVYPLARRAARRVWFVAFTLGSLFGVVQILRGAHFLSHVLWSAWVVWVVNVALVSVCLLLFSPRSDERPAMSSITEKGLSQGARLSE